MHDSQRLLGYRTLNLLNANGDATFLRQVLYTEIARRYVTTPSANYIRVVINGEYWGVYVNTQQFNADFTREWFASTKGTRWKVPGSPRGRGGMDTSARTPTPTEPFTKSNPRKTLPHGDR